MLVHLHGALLPADRAHVSPFDRGFLFGDGIYEGLRCGVISGRRRVIGLSRHLRRMAAGLATAGIEFDPATLGPATEALLDANGLSEAFIYWQVTSGAPDPATQTPRSRVPPAGLRPTVFGYCTPLPALSTLAEPAIKACAVRPDRRWELGHVKSISLLGNVMEAIDAAERGADEAVLVREHAGRRLVTEGTYTNVVIVTSRSAPDANLPPPFDRYEVATPSLRSAPLLAGVTREILLDVEPNLVERAIDAAELGRADEVILVGTTTMVTSVSRLDGRSLGDGRIGPVARHLFHRLLDAIRSGADELSGNRPLRRGVTATGAS
ncbi:MAG: aminotransferase class IV [Phycisphaerae bacterium]|nr:aminotransferase class IV [Phycisphaerae bacterium]